MWCSGSSAAPYFHTILWQRLSQGVAASDGKGAFPLGWQRSPRARPGEYSLGTENNGSETNTHFLVALTAGRLDSSWSGIEMGKRRKKKYGGVNCPFFCLYPLSGEASVRELWSWPWAVSREEGSREVMEKPSVRTPSLCETLCPDISLWNVIFKWCFQPSIVLFMFLLFLLQILPGECMDIIVGVLRSRVVCFPCKAVPLPPWISCIPTGGACLPPPLLGWSLWAGAAPRLMLQQP